MRCLSEVWNLAALPSAVTILTDAELEWLQSGVVAKNCCGSWEAKTAPTTMPPTRGTVSQDVGFCSRHRKPVVLLRSQNHARCLASHRKLRSDRRSTAHAWRCHPAPRKCLLVTPEPGACKAALVRTRVAMDWIGDEIL